MQQMMVDSCVGEPIDWLWARLQHLDEQSGGLFDIQRASTSPFVECQKQLTDMMVMEVRGSPLQCVVGHFTGCDPDFDWEGLYDGIRLSTLSTGAYVYWRLVCVLDDWPFTLLVLVHRCSSAQEIDHVLRRFGTCADCCLGASCGHKIRDFFPDKESMMDDRELMDML